MPSPLTSSFASAAANSGTDGTPSRRVDGVGNGEWPRSRINGATQTFRRPSLATNPSSTREGAQNAPPTSSANTGVYIPPHLNSNSSSAYLRNGVSGESRYNKDHMMDIYRSQRDSGALDRNLGQLFLGDWSPYEQKDGGGSTWGKRDEGKDLNSGPEVCWNHEVDEDPLGLVGMSGEEQELFSTSVNSPLKPPQNTAKDGNASVTGSGRKTSISAHLGPFNSNTPTSARPGPRRRDTSDSFSASGPLSPTGNTKFFGEDRNAAMPPSALLRRKTDFKEETTDPGNDPRDSEGNSRNFPGDLNSPFGSLKRSATGPNGGLGGSASSAWAPGAQGSGFAPMGSFGSFAIGSSPASQQESAEKRPGFGSARGGSRFKDLLSKTSMEDASPSMKEKASLGNLERLPEMESETSHFNQNDTLRTRSTRSETNPYGENVPRSGSAALGGAQDASPPHSGIDQLGFSAFAVPSNINARDFMQQGSHHSLQHQTPQPRHRGHEPMSPTTTNPYQSPDGERTDVDEDDTNESGLQHSGNLGYSSMVDGIRGAPFGSIRRGMMPGADERDQIPTSGPGRAFGGLGGLASSAAWPTSGFGSGTPIRERAPFGSAFPDQLFGSMGDLQSPSIAFGGNGIFGSPALSSVAANGRSSKLGALFPPAMQEQMRGDRAKSDGNDDASERFHGESELRNLGNAGYEGESQYPHRAGGSIPEEGHNLNYPNHLLRGSEDSGVPSHYQTSNSGNGPTMPSAADLSAHMGQGTSQSSGSSSSNQLPAAQQRQMVMPDRMRWIYRDPQGTTQGPWSGLEMHDWFKAGFFTAELQVKKLEDAEYEPLAQLVRRIGNSREPFLVPQIGVPHGPAVTSPGNQWAGPAAPPTIGTVPPQTGPAQPPFASSFPSFGTTLTAEQQNALERRKQEEQYLMARQKEHLAQQQVLMKQMQLQGGPHAMHSLQHHSSAHSLQSQPSFGSITSPTGGYQPSPNQGPIQAPQNVPGFFEGSMRQAPTSNMGQSMSATDFRSPREDEVSSMVERMNFNQRGPFPFGPGSIGSQLPEGGPTPQQISSMLQDRARLQMEQQQADMRSQNHGFSEQAGQSERLREFHALREGANELYLAFHQNEGSAQQPIGAPLRQVAEEQFRRDQNADTLPTPIGQSGASRAPLSTAQDTNTMSLTQQVQKAASASAQQQSASNVESPWGQVEAGLPVQGLPPPSVSPLPAPAAQRNRQHVADALAAESRSQTQTPVETPSTSLAPWAEKSHDAPKGPSLREIQETEARKAAQQEEVMVATRRAQAEQERFVLPVAPAPGLPSTSNWATSGSPATPTTPGVSVWAKSASGKPVAAPSNAKKTLAQIQKEEESRKQRAAAATAQKTSTIPVAAGGTRYADLASKISIAMPIGPPGAWTTVGSSGKAKAPITVVATPPPVSRVVSNPATAPSLVATTRPRPVAPIVRSTTALANQSKATDEFTKWTKGALSKGLNNNINVDDFVQSLLSLPSETEIISDSVYANSQTLDGRRFAEEFVRRRKLADKGILDPAANGTTPSPATDNKSGGGWSEVAKKGPASGVTKEEPASAFKVVAAKKKGKR